jgi:hypothetical protein
MDGPLVGGEGGARSHDLGFDEYNDTLKLNCENPIPP